jgi:hypothetical protein
MWDTWRHQSSPLPGGGPGATGHAMTPEPSRTGRRVWNRGTRGDTVALPCREASPVSRGTWRCRSPPMLGARSGAVGLDLSLVRRGTWSARYRQWPPGPPRERQRTHRWGQYLFSHATLTIFILDGFEAVVRFHQRTHGRI